MSYRAHKLDVKWPKLLIGSVFVYHFLLTIKFQFGLLWASFFLRHMVSKVPNFSDTWSLAALVFMIPISSILSYTFARIYDARVRRLCWRTNRANSINVWQSRKVHPRWQAVVLIYHTYRWYPGIHRYKRYMWFLVHINTYRATCFPYGQNQDGRGRYVAYRSRIT